MAPVVSNTVYTMRCSGCGKTHHDTCKIGCTASTVRKEAFAIGWSSGNQKVLCPMCNVRVSQYPDLVPSCTLSYGAQNREYALFDDYQTFLLTIRNYEENWLKGHRQREFENSRIWKYAIKPSLIILGTNLLLSPIWFVFVS